MRYEDEVLFRFSIPDEDKEFFKQRLSRCSLCQYWERFRFANNRDACRPAEGDHISEVSYERHRSLLC
jgi:hypothetical protein